MQVRAVRLRRDRIVVALEHKVLVYNFADLKVLHQIDTCANMRGLVAISSTTAMSATADNTVLACPGYQTGQVCGRSRVSCRLGAYVLSGVGIWRLLAVCMCV
jgi:hypothetical protein